MLRLRGHDGRAGPRIPHHREEPQAAHSRARKPSIPSEHASPEYPEAGSGAQDHTPHHHKESKRVQIAGGRIARETRSGMDVGPLRVYPGGVAVTYARAPVPSH